MRMNLNDLVVWVDLETTGLDEKDGLPLEVGMLITDTDLKEIATYETIIQWGKIDWNTAMVGFVQDMHTESGLIKEYEEGAGVSIDAASELFLEFLGAHDALALPMAGSNVANFDRAWLREFMPQLNDGFHYRNIDVSSIKESCRIWNPDIYAKLPPKAEGHRVIADCRDTVEEFRFYHDNFLWTTR